MRGMGLLVVLMAMGLGACGGDPLAMGTDSTVTLDAGAGGAGGVAAADAGAPDPCTRIAPGAPLVGSHGQSVVNVRCDRVCAPATSPAFCIDGNGRTMYCEACGLPPCAQVVTAVDTCEGSPGTACCLSCSYGDQAGELTGCAGVTPSGAPVICATSLADCR